MKLNIQTYLESIPFAGLEGYDMQTMLVNDPSAHNGTNVSAFKHPVTFAIVIDLSQSLV